MHLPHRLGRASALLITSLSALAAGESPAVTTREKATPEPAAPPPVVRLLFDAYPPDHVFTGNAVALPTRLTNATDRAVECVVRTWLSRYCPCEDGVPVDVDERLVALAAGGSTDVLVSFQPKEAGPYEFRVMVTEADQPVANAESTLLFNPREWTLPEYEPGDFDAFWQQTLTALRARPLDALESDPITRPRIPDGFREVSFNGLGDRCIRGYFALPLGYEEGQKVPALLSLPSAGYHCAAIDATAVSNGYAVLAISVHDLPFDEQSGLDHPRAQWLPQPYQGFGRESKETFFFRAATAAGPRAVDYLRARPEIDPAKIVVTGFSQGGTLAVATAALVPDIALVEVGLPGHSRMDLLTSAYRTGPVLDPPVGMEPGELLERTLAYYDSSFFARRVRCPALTRISLDDEVHPGPLQYWTYLQIINSPDSRLMIAPWRQHLLPPDVHGMIPELRHRYAPVAPSSQ